MEPTCAPTFQFTDGLTERSLRPEQLDKRVNVGKGHPAVAVAVGVEPGTAGMVLVPGRLPREGFDEQVDVGERYPTVAVDLGGTGRGIGTLAGRPGRYSALGTLGAPLA